MVYGNSIHNPKKITTLKISAEACSLILLLWEITCKKMPPYLLRKKRHVQPALHTVDVTGNWSIKKKVLTRVFSLDLKLYVENLVSSRDKNTIKLFYQRITG